MSESANLWKFSCREDGAFETVRHDLRKQGDIYTLLRLPTGIFYAQGAKTNVLIFDRKPAASLDLIMSRKTIGGVAPEQPYVINKIDTDYFEE
jgi:hypothetical protein